MAKLNRIVLMGSPDYAVPTLMALHKDFPEKIVGVLTQPDRPTGRHRYTLTPTPIKTAALACNIPTFTPGSKDEIHEILHQLNPDLVIVIAYGRILSEKTVTQFYCINAHGSLLPAYRGASPVQSSLLNLDKTTGVSLIKMDATMDTGPILLTESFEIPDEMHFTPLFKILSDLSAKLCLKFIKDCWLNDKIILHNQDHTKATYCKKLSRKDAELTKEASIDIWWGKIKAFSGNISAWLALKNGSIKIIEATRKNHVLIPTIVQPEGKKPMTYKDYLSGNTEELCLPPC